MVAQIEAREVVKMTGPKVVAPTVKDVMTVAVKDLMRLLGFRSYKTFYTACLTKRLPVRVFELPGRKGKFAKTEWPSFWGALRSYIKIAVAIIMAASRFRDAIGESDRGLKPWRAALGKVSTTRAEKNAGRP